MVLRLTLSYFGQNFTCLGILIGKQPDYCSGSNASRSKRTYVLFGSLVTAEIRMITTRLMAITLPSCLHDYKVNQRCLSVKCIRPHDTQPFLWSYQDKHKIGSPLYIPDIRRIHSQCIQLCVPDTKLQLRLTTPNKNYKN